MRIPKSRYLTLFLAGCALAVLGWCMQTYVDLVRLEATAVDTRARVETASRVRLDLVENLLRDARDRSGASDLERVDRAVARVREVGLLPASLVDGDGQTVFREAQGDLTLALNAVWAGQAAVRDPSMEVAIADLKPEIERWSEAINRGLAELDRHLESFRSSAAGFPGALIAAIPRREGPADRLAETGTTGADRPLPVSGAVR